jgi:hypothetical protein
MMTRWDCLRLGLLLPLMAAAGGCALISASSSIRVDVEVYKGPLSREPSVQLAELQGIWREFRQSLDGYRAALCGAYVAEIEVELKDTNPDTKTQVRYAMEKCKNGEEREPSITTQKCAGYEKQVLSPVEAASCFYIAQVYADTRDLHKALRHVTDYERANAAKIFWGDPKPGLNKETAEFLNRVSTLAMQMKLKAYYWALGQVSFPIYTRLTRAAVTNFSNLASEYANQLSSRADALLIQGRNRDAIAAQLLAQSIYLRDSQPTDFLNLYTWNRAILPALPEDMVLHPYESFSAEETATRVRGFERLYGDHYWSRINTVTANGDGEVRMALIKDDIGNWNLKSFDSDATELLKAYTSGAITLIEKAVDTAKSAAGPAAASGLLAMAGGMAFSSAAPAQAAPASKASGADPVAILHRNAMERLSKAHSDGALRLNKAPTEEAGAKENARRKMELAEKEPTKDMCIEKELPAVDASALASRLDVLVSQILAGVADARAEVKRKGIDSSAATAQWAKAESAAGDIRKQSADVQADSDEQKVLCAKALAARARLEAGNAYLEAATHAGRGAKARERTIAEWKSILAEHARAVMALSEAAAAERDDAPRGQDPSHQTARDSGSEAKAKLRALVRE